MIILTSEALRVDPASIIIQHWHGPQVLALLPGNGLSRRQVRELATTHYVVDFLQRSSSAGALLNDVLSFLRHEVEHAEWPLVFIGEPVENDTLDALIRPVIDRPHEVRAAFGDSNRLTRLSLGELVVTSPLMLEFFAMVATREVDDMLLADLLSDTFSWDM